MPQQRCVARPRHPTTGRRLYVAAASPRELQAYLEMIERYRRELKHGLAEPEDVARKIARINHGAVTLERAARSYMERVAPNTRRRVASVLTTQWRELAALQLEQLEASRLAAWVERLRGQGLAASTIGLSWRTLRAVVRHAAERGWFPGRAPWGSWRPRAGRDGSDRLAREAARGPQEVLALLEAGRALDAEADRRGRLGDLAAKIAAAALAGLRQGELAGLRWPDVDAQGGAVAIVHGQGDAPTKTRAVQIVRALPELFAELETLRARLMSRDLFDPKGPVFVCARLSRRGAPLPYPFRVEVLPRAQLRKAVERAALPNPERWSPHSLRDSFVTLEVQGARGDLAAVAPRSRHATIGSLVRYLHARERAERPAPMFQLPQPLPRLSAGRPRRGRG